MTVGILDPKSYDAELVPLGRVSLWFDQSIFLWVKIPISWDLSYLTDFKQIWPLWNHSHHPYRSCWNLCVRELYSSGWLLRGGQVPYKKVSFGAFIGKLLTGIMRRLGQARASSHLLVIVLQNLRFISAMKWSNSSIAHYIAYKSTVNLTQRLALKAKAIQSTLI